MKATETITEQVPGGVTHEGHGGLKEGWGGLGVSPTTGGVEGFGGLR